MIVAGEWIGSGWSEGKSGAYKQDKASALTFLCPGQQEIVKWKRVKKKAHQACQGLSLLASLNPDYDGQYLPQMDLLLPPANVSTVPALVWSYNVVQ